MSTLVLDVEPVAVEVSVTDDDLTVRLADGRRISIPLAWYPRLLNATKDERMHWQLLGDGYAIEWLGSKACWPDGQAEKVRMFLRNGLIHAAGRNRLHVG